MRVSGRSEPRTADSGNFSRAVVVDLAFHYVGELVIRLVNDKQPLARDASETLQIFDRAALPGGRMRAWNVDDTRGLCGVFRAVIQYCNQRVKVHGEVLSKRNFGKLRSQQLRIQAIE